MNFSNFLILHGKPDFSSDTPPYPPNSFFVADGDEDGVEVSFLVFVRLIFMEVLGMNFPNRVVASGEYINVEQLELLGEAVEAVSDLFILN